MPGQVKTYGFSLVEMLAVVVIITILVSLAVVLVGALMIRAEADEVRTELQVIMTAIQAYYDEKGSYPVEDTPATPRSLGEQLRDVPAALDRLASLSETAFGDSGDLQDRYRKKIDYFREGGAGGTPVLQSWGADGIEGTTDDIWSDGRKHEDD